MTREKKEKKTSGAAFKKKKIHRLESDVKLQKTFSKWLEKSSTVIQTENNNLHINQNNDSHKSSDVCSSNNNNENVAAVASCSSKDFDKELIEVQDEISSQKLSFQCQDPATWPTKIPDKTKCFLVEQGPKQDKMETYPNTLCSIDKRTRQFSKKWFEKVLPNGEKFNRQWLLYSFTRDALFCFCCILFSSKKQSYFADVSKGFNDWKKLNPRVSEHENCIDHQKCYSDWKTLEKNLNEGKTLDDELQRAINGEVKKWRAILKVIIDAILFCAKNNLALRGTTDLIGAKQSGIFLNLIEMIGNYQPLVAQHISSVKSKKTSTSYFSPQIQNELIEIIGQQVKNEILLTIKASKYFSILFDCTPDVSHKEQMTQIVRYVRVKDGKCSIEESFVDFIESHEKSGKGLATEITEKLKNDGLNIEDCRGQGYDNGANMAGKYKGVQAQISSLNELARFVPCANHTLNLVGVHAAAVSPLMITFFGRVQAIFNFFSSSTSRWEKLMEKLSISLKSNSDTRWSAKKEAITPLHRQIKEVLEVLHDICTDSKMNAETVFGANQLVKQIDFSFLCLLDFWCQILSLIDRENNALQSKNISIDMASRKIQGLVASIQNLRDIGISGVLKAAATTAEQIGIESDFPTKRRKKVKLMSLYEGKDDFNPTPEKEFEMQCNIVFDSIITQMQWRFESMSKVSSDFDFLTGNSLSTSSVDQLKVRASCLANLYHSDLNSLDFQSEIVGFKFQANAMIDNLETSTPMDLLQLIHKYSLTDAYPNTAIALRIFLTIPVTVASCERSFSKLKLIKNYLRSTMGQERLSSLAIVSIENEVANSINYDNVINQFATAKARKVALK
jgi:hypothetical protein